MYKPKLFAVVIIVISLFACNFDSDENSPPNIVIFLADDQGWGDLSHSGNTNLSTPNIDAIAQEGASFTNFYVQPVCSPTRAEFLTGRYAARSGVYSTSAGGERIDLDETTIAELFKTAGYATGAFGKWHNGMQFPYHPNARGFDEFYGFCSGHWGSYFDPMLEHNGTIVQGDGFLADDITSKAMRFVEQHQSEPFLVYLPFNTPHSPMQVPDEFWKRFEDKSLDLSANSGDQEDELFTKAALAMTENLDWNVGRMLRKLEELQLEDNTIVIYFTDNGPNGFRWNGAMKGKKGSTDEGGVRSPLFVKWPKQIKKGTELLQISGAIDLMPTLTELAGIEYDQSKTLDGLSMAPALQHNSDAIDDRILFNHWRGVTSVRNQNYRLDENNRLYAISNDRAQTTDLGNDLPEIRQELMEAKETYQKSVLSELPEEDLRTFPLGHPDEKITQIPARDGVGHGNILRSNTYPNCSFFTNWIDVDDYITWNVEVLEKGKFEVLLYYTCPKGDEGSTITLTVGNASLSTSIDAAFETPLRGMEHDRVPRIESYVKDFKPLSMGTIELEKGNALVELKSLTKPGPTVMDVRLLLFKRL